MNSSLVYTGKNGRSITIRNATVADVPVVVNNLQLVADERRYVATEHVSEDQKERIRKRMSDGNALSIVAEVEEKVVGALSMGQYGSWDKTKHVFELSMAVVEGYREIGTGTALLDFAIRWAKEKRISKLCLSVFSTNDRAIRLYKKFGFESEGVRRKQFFIDGEFVDEISMGLFLDP